MFSDIERRVTDRIFTAIHYRIGQPITHKLGDAEEERSPEYLEAETQAREIIASVQQDVATARRAAKRERVESILGGAVVLFVLGPIMSWLVTGRSLGHWLSMPFACR